MKRVLVIGQSGLQKNRYLSEVQELLKEKNIDLKFDNVGDEMIEIHNKKITEDNILNLQKELLEELRSHALKNIIERAEHLKSNFHAISAHVVFRWDHGLFPVIDIDLLKQYNPDFVICLIDDIVNIQYNLTQRGINKFKLWELFAWREEEIWIGKMATNFLSKLINKNIPYFILPKGQGPGLFAQIILAEPSSPKVYMSFPITGVFNENEKKEIEKFKKGISSNLIAFDPYAIKDRELTNTYYSLEGEIKEDLKDITGKLKLQSQSAKFVEKKFWEICLGEDTVLGLIKFMNLERLGFPSIELLGREFLSTAKAIDAQIVARDFLLIEQSDFIIIYIKVEPDGETPRISAGCQAELSHAYDHGKPVYVIFKGRREKLSPFVTEFANVFSTSQDCLKFIKKRYSYKGGKSNEKK